MRDALLVLASTTDGFRRAFGTREEVDPVRHLLGTAAGWGGNPDKDAVYLSANSARNDGTTVYKVAVKDVPVNAFWSISVYNAQGYFEKNPLDAYTVNSIIGKKGADGAVVVQFGGCDGKVPNCIPIVKGWNYTVRLYRPRAEILNGSWKFPEASARAIVDNPRLGRALNEGDTMNLMLQTLARNWWVLLLRGLAAVGFGVLAIVWPGVTVLWMVLIYGFYALADGVLAIVVAIKGGGAAPRAWLVITGLAGIAAGVLTFAWPGVTALVLVFFIAGWAIVTGAMQIMAAIRLRKEIEGEWLLVAGGVVSLIFGIVLFARPGEGAIALAFVIGAFAIAYGVLLVAFALRLRRVAGRPTPGTAHAT